jgi:hypothetical protein
MMHWRDLDAYSPFARLLVEHMWAQRPPLQPAQFAARVGVRRQRLSSWLTSDAVPPPPVVMQVARGMGLPVRDLLIAAGHATAEDPLRDEDDAWALVTAEIGRRVVSLPHWDTVAPAQRAALVSVLARLWGKRAPPIAGASTAAPPRDDALDLGALGDLGEGADDERDTGQ